MRSSDPKSKPALGFLTVVEDPEDGLFGGYLLLNLAGRPLEFHCTAPVKPNRAQQILYGPTLEPYLFGEQIGQALYSKSKIEPLVVCTDCGPALALREHVDVPVTLIIPDDSASPPPGSTDSRAEKQWRIDPSHPGCPAMTAFQVGCNRLAVPQRHADDGGRIAERLVDLADSFDLAEPFARIREAIGEARQGG